MTALNELTKTKDNITPIKTAKFIFGTLISCGAMAATVVVLSGPMRNCKGLTKLLMKLGIFVIGCKVGDMAEDYFNESVDKLIEEINKIIKETKEELKDEPAAK